MFWRNGCCFWHRSGLLRDEGGSQGRAASRSLEGGKHRRSVFGQGPRERGSARRVERSRSRASGDVGRGSRTRRIGRCVLPQREAGGVESGVCRQRPRTGVPRFSANGQGGERGEGVGPPPSPPMAKTGERGAGVRGEREDRWADRDRHAEARSSEGSGTNRTQGEAGTIAGRAAGIEHETAVDEDVGDPLAVLEGLKIGG